MYLIRLPYHARQLHFCDADKTGARVADLNVMEAALTLDTVDGVYVVNDNVEYSGMEECHTLTSPNVFEGSSLWIRSRIQSGGDYIAIVSVTDFPKLALWRQQLGVDLPICALVHAIPYEHLVPMYLTSACLARPYDRVFASSEAGKGAVVSFLEQCESLLRMRTGDDALLSKQTRVVPLPVTSMHTESCAKEHARRSFGVPQDAVVFLAFGRLTPSYKADLEPMIYAFSSVKSPVSRHLVIAGHEVEAGYVDRLKGFAESCNVATNVTFVLNVPAYSKQMIYALGDVFVAPSDNIQETFGLAVVEAMTAGLPVVASDWSGYRELVVDEVTGFLIPTWMDIEDKERLSMIAALGRVPSFEKVMAQRTILDVGAMISAFERLVDSRLLRLSMGEAGMVRATSSFGKERVLSLYRSIWWEQLEQARSCIQHSTRYFNFIEPYRGFPSTGPELGSMHIKTPQSEESTEQGELIGALVENRRIGDIFREGGLERGIARKLLKKGIFRVRR